MPRRRRDRSALPRSCELCQRLVQIRYRIQYDESRVWRLVCPDCQVRCSLENPYYRYGGTWKAR